MSTRTIAALGLCLLLSPPAAAQTKKPYPDTKSPKQLMGREGHTYFANAAQHPFQPNAQGRSLVNAWWLAEMSMLSMKDRQAVQSTIGQALPGAKTTWFENKNTQAFVTETPDFAIVSFRGTEVITNKDALGELRDYGRNARTRLVPAQRRRAGEPPTPAVARLRSLRGGPKANESLSKVHKGFQSSLDAIWPQLQRTLKALPQDKPVYFTGHSLGAAMATLAADRSAGRLNVAGIYTYGSPKVGNAAFARSFPYADKTYRFRHAKDLVSGVPLRDSYRHIGAPTFITKSGQLRTSAGNVPHRSLFDHAPLAYSVKLWNAYVDERLALQKRKGITGSLPAGSRR